MSRNYAYTKTKYVYSEIVVLQWKDKIIPIIMFYLYIGLINQHKFV